VLHKIKHKNKILTLLLHWNLLKKYLYSTWGSDWAYSLVAHSSCPHVRWVPCHHGVARPRVADGGDSLQFWRVAANILNKQSQTADMGWWGLGLGLTTPHRKK
jgi:hypothetical protein